MGVVGSLPSPPFPPAILNETIKIDHDESTSSSSTDNDSCSYMIIDEIESNTNSSSSSIVSQSKKCNHRPKAASPVTVMYGPINIKVRQSAAPTLATGRRSKFVELQGDASVKRELRRKRNREAAKKLKEKRAIIEDDLTKQISEHEIKEKELLTTIENLKTYKGYLENQWRQIVSLEERVARSAFKKVEQNRRRLHQSVRIHQTDSDIKEEPRSPSPQWQLLFSI